MRNFDVIIIGAGAAGLMCAIEAGKRGRRVGVLEHAGEAGKKILISGGGRANFTNIHCRPENFLSANPHFAKSALARYTPADFIALVEKHGIPYHEKTLGQLFCDRSARDIVDMLLAECRRAAVSLIVNCAVEEVRKTTQFVLLSNHGEFQAPALVVSSGGLSIPKIGASPFGYRIARQFGLDVEPCRPALVPLVLSEPDRKKYCDLAGVSTEVIACAGGRSFREKMLITHRGLSGPAILQISSYWKDAQPISIDLLPGFDTLPPRLADLLPKRLADRWTQWNVPAGLQPADIAARLHCWQFVPGGTEGYGKAEVTAGGVDTRELSSKTFESRKVPGLYFIGEVVDVTGHLGGFNFQWAWASGYCAGQHV